MEHSFTPIIKSILSELYGEIANDIFERSLLIQYINEKTASANRGSKSRPSFGNLYAIYVVVEDYIVKKYNVEGNYSEYEGAKYIDLFKRQRELPFGGKLQNHSLNNRMNAEFQKFFPTTDIIPIIRNLETNRYWINENLLLITNGKEVCNIATAIIRIIDEYVKIKQDSFQRFIKQCEELKMVEDQRPTDIRNFIVKMLAPNVDARLFEIASYAILKYLYRGQEVIWGYSLDKMTHDHLRLYKTGRTNANDGGIDFVMRPLGRFFQVTETLDFKKYFLDIEKIERFPITFVVKSTESIETLKDKLRTDAIKSYRITAVVDKYMSCIEELINIKMLYDYLLKLEKEGCLSEVLDEIILQSKLEYNYEDEE